ncbi:neutral zinc metallopeptidase [Actinomadura xylanilytica]|uniref:neutral zinc metallopeptidase n=1 Tax=Actinomadura xylanilytica TaxID=887459 RepID=UPI00255B08C4|nr:neutral zinc metallopeptidase [Actinomadura xylanilytica]MDL4773402.1 neutral zinc metallopeptidase [Actinomadura xylanilytica]
MGCRPLALVRGGGGRVNPDKFPHGTSQQRRTWLTTGPRSGEPAGCATFSDPIRPRRLEA